MQQAIKLGIRVVSEEELSEIIVGRLVISKAEPAQMAPNQAEPAPEDVIP